MKDRWTSLQSQERYEGEKCNGKLDERENDMDSVGSNVPSARLQDSILGGNGNDDDKGGKGGASSEIKPLDRIMYDEQVQGLYQE